MNDVYWIYEDKFIFKPEFNEPIDKYVNTIKNYSQLIFSNYYMSRNIVSYYFLFKMYYCN